MDDSIATRMPTATADVAAERVTAFLRTVYGWMFVGLGVTAVVAYAVAGSPAINQIIASNHIVFAGALVAELGLVFYLSARVQNLTANVAGGRKPRPAARDRRLVGVALESADQAAWEERQWQGAKRVAQNSRTLRSGFAAATGVARFS